jgi:sulfatase modifying factor 1
MSSNQDDTLLPSSRSSTNSGELNGDTVLPFKSATGIHTAGDVIDNRYTVIREIGRGGMGVVYEVEDAITGDRYAVKRLLPAFASRPEIIQQFRTEGAASIRFTNQSRHFVSTQTVGLDNGQPYIVMQLIAHPTLRTLLNQSGGRLDIETALPILGAIATVLAELHDFGLIHRDLKPENIFVDQLASTPRVMLVDFGLTKDGSDATATALKFGGTERYASPEQKKGLTTTSASDIYSFGVIAFEVLAGELPGVGDTLSDFVEDVPGQVATIVMQCLATRPERRPQNAITLASTFVRIQQSEIHVELAERKNEDLIAQPSQPIELLTSTISFPDLQTDASIVIDGDLILTGGDYTCELLSGTSKSLDVVVSWEGVHLFQDSVHLVAGESKSIPTQKAYRIDCDVPEWCEVKDANGKQVEFPVKGLLSNPSATISYSLSHQGRVFESLSVVPKAGEQQVKLDYGIGILQIKDVPDGCQVRVNHYVVSEQFSVPIRTGSTVSVSIRVYDKKLTEIYRGTVQLQANQSKQFRVPNTVTAESAHIHVSPVSIEPQTAVGETSRNPVRDLTRRIVIGGGIAAVLGGGGWFVCGRDNRTPMTRSDYPAKTRPDKITEAHLVNEMYSAALICRPRFPELSRYLVNMRVIPACVFFAGSNYGESDEAPRHPVELSYFTLGAAPVTVAMWKEYCNATEVKLPSKPPWGWIDDHPIVNVSWNDIMGLDGRSGYCGWAKHISDIRISIPTEAQFEFASLGGRNGLMYPWGNSFDDSYLWCVKSPQQRGTASVRRSSNVHQNKFGLSDMSGNVWQWCFDIYGPYRNKQQTDPMGPSSTSKNRCVRGGSWRYISPDGYRCANRWELRPDVRSSEVGFRLSVGPS